MEYFCNVIVPGLGKMFCPTKIFGCTVTINNYCTVSSPVPFSYHIIECGVDIHLSGRTGRAGRSGVSILFYKSQQEHMTPLMERKSGVQFQRIGAPQPVDTVKTGAKDSIK